MELRNRGFTRLHAHDGSAEMLKKAEERKLFEEYFVECLYENKPTTKLQPGFYDALVNVGKNMRFYCQSCFVKRSIAEMLR